MFFQFKIDETYRDCPGATGIADDITVQGRYANIERELLAVVYGCEKFHTYLYGRHFVVESDHRPLEQIHKKNLDMAPPRLQRMLLRLQPYDCIIQYKPSKEMVIADTLSRLSPRNRDEVPGMQVKIHHVSEFSPVELQKIFLTKLLKMKLFKFSADKL